MKRRAFLCLAGSSLATPGLIRARPRYGGTLRVFPDSLLQSALETLLPEVCEPIQQDAARRMWIVTPKPGILRHDKTALNAEAVADMVKAKAPGQVGVTVSGKSVLVTAAKPSVDVLEMLQERIEVDCGPFRARRESGASFAEAFEEHWEGRPFLDRIEMARAATGADVAELAPAAVRQFRSADHYLWSTLPIQLLAIDGSSLSAETRTALSLAIDREAIVRFLLQGHGEIAGGLLPQWASGWAFLFSTQRDVAKARSFARATPIALGHSAADRLIGERIALNARDAGFDVRPVLSRQTGATLVRLELPRVSSYEAERAALDERGLIPIAHVPRIFAIHKQVRGWPAEGEASQDKRIGEPRFADVWLAPV